MKIAFVGCTKEKRDYTCKAEEMYMKSSLFRLGSTYIRNQGFNAWYILSAEYGLVHPQFAIEPYDKTLNNFSKKELEHWANMVFKQIPKATTEAHFYTGVSYSKNLIPMLEREGVKCFEPLKGLGIGQRLAYFKNWGSNTKK